MLLNKIAIGLMSLCLIGTSLSAEAGIVSKGINVYVATKIVQKTVPVITKKIAEKKAKKVVQDGIKDSTKPLLKNELKVGKYGTLKQSPEKGLDYHHIPSTKQIEKYGIKKDDGIAMGMQHDRHTLTRTYKNGNKQILRENEAPRDALAKDIKDNKQIYKDNGHYNNNIRDSLQNVIKQNKEKFPELYKKNKEAPI